MPCQSCKDAAKQRKAIQPSEIHRLTPHLDNAENELLIAAVNEIQPENIQYLNTLLEVIRRMKNVAYATRPLQLRFYGLLIAANDVVKDIPCQYCRHHMEYRLNGAIREAIEAERGHYWHLFKLLVRNEVRGSYWLLLACWYRKLKPMFHLN